MMACSDYYDIVLEYTNEDDRTIYLGRGEENTDGITPYVVFEEIMEYTTRDYKRFSTFHEALRYFKSWVLIMCSKDFYNRKENYDSIMLKIKQLEKN